MSYILEALKKSERERARGSIPTLETAPDNGFGRRNLWRGAFIGAGVLALMAGVAWSISVYLIHRDEPAAPAGASVSPEDGGPVAADAAGGAETRTGSATRHEQSGRTGEESAGGVAASTGEPAPEPDGTPGTRSRESDSPTRVSRLSELGPQARGRIQDLSLNVVSYSQTPERRFVMLNQRIYRESDTVADGVVVKRILPDGALLSVGGYEIVIRPQ